MITELKRDEKNSDFQVKLTLGAARIYASQFNRDLPTDLYELATEINSKQVQKAVKSIKLKGKNISQMSDEDFQALVMENIDVAELIVERPLTLEQCDRGVNIIWAFAKNADASIKLPEAWLEGFEQFPIRKYINSLFDLWTNIQNGTIELKNV